MPDIPVVVRGKLDKSDDNNKIIADKVIGLEDYTPEFCIIVKPEQEDNAFFSNLKNLLGKNSIKQR